MRPLSFFLLFLLAFSAWSAESAALYRLRLRLALQEMESAPLSYFHWVTRGGRRQCFRVEQRPMEDDVGLLRRESLQFPRDERSRMTHWQYSREVRYSDGVSTLITYVGPARVRAIRLSWPPYGPVLREGDGFFGRGLSLSSRPLWLISQEAGGHWEDFAVDRRGNRLLLWRIFDGEGRLLESHSYTDFRLESADLPEESDFHPELDNVLLWEAINPEEYRQALKEVRLQEERELKQLRHLPRSFLPATGEAWSDFLTAPFRSPSRLILLLLALLGLLPLAFPPLRRRRASAPSPGP